MDVLGRIRVRRVLDELVAAEEHANTLLAAHGSQWQEYIDADSWIRRLWAKLHRAESKGELYSRSLSSVAMTNEGGGPAGPGVQRALRKQHAERN